ncbi:MAG TPA: AMP-binding protein [Stellaceae bacterium]|nr:AMP-binding protein [Stellaceae bacterium]
MSILPLSEVVSGARPDTHPVACRNGEVVTLRRLRAEIAHNARALHGARRALLVCDDSYSFVVGLLALLHAGADVVLPPNTQSGTLRLIGPSYDLLVSDRDRADVARTFVLEPSDATVEPMPLAVGGRRIDFFTSGSTGEMKRIEKTAALLECEARVLDGLWGEHLATARIYGTVSHQHIFGLTFKVMWPLLAGRCFSTATHEVWETLLAELTPAALIVSSPAHLTRLGGLRPLPEALRPRMILTAGAPLPIAAAAETQEVFGVAPTEIFGSTETGAAAWRKVSAEPPLWQPLPGVEIRARDGGLLRLRSPFVAGDGWCDLADRVVIGADGRFGFEGRADRVLKVEGKRVSLQQLEQDIARLPLIEAAAVAAIGDERTVVGAVVTLSPAGRCELTRLGKFRFTRMLRRELAAMHDAAVLPRRWRFVERMPMDGMGKRRNRDIAALLEEQR